jgi:hypothetical protein
MDEKGNVINAKNCNIDATLDEISKELKPNETLILDVGDRCHDQTDVIYDTLVMRGYSVKKIVKKGRNLIIINF